MPYGNHKAQTYNRDTKNKQRRDSNKAHHYRKSSIHKGRPQETRKEIREPYNVIKQLTI